MGLSNSVIKFHNDAEGEKILKEASIKSFNWLSTNYPTKIIKSNFYYDEYYYGLRNANIDSVLQYSIVNNFYKTACIFVDRMIEFYKETKDEKYMKILGYRNNNDENALIMAFDNNWDFFLKLYEYKDYSDPTGYFNNLVYSYLKSKTFKKSTEIQNIYLINKLLKNNSNAITSVLDNYAIKYTLTHYEINFLLVNFGYNINRVKSDLTLFSKIIMSLPCSNHVSEYEKVLNLFERYKYTYNWKHLYDKKNSTIHIAIKYNNFVIFKYLLPFYDKCDKNILIEYIFEIYTDNMIYKKMILELTLDEKNLINEKNLAMAKNYIHINEKVLPLPDISSSSTSAFSSELSVLPTPSAPPAEQNPFPNIFGIVSSVPEILSNITPPPYSYE